MKFKKSSILFALLLMILGTYSCTKDTNDKLSFEIQDAEEIMKAYNEGKQAQDKGELIVGDIYIRSATENMILVFVKSPKLGESLMYSLQMNEPNNKNFETSIENGQILFFKESLIINSLDKNLKYLFKLGSVSNRLPQLKFTNTFVGYGLNRVTGFSWNEDIASFRANTYGIPGDPPPEDALICKCYTSETVPSNCDSGGAGSSSCSTSSSGDSCSVSCDSGYDACCF